MSDDRKTPVWPWIAALLIALPMLYVASFGPACRLTQRRFLPESIFIAAYRPCIWIANYGPRPAMRTAWWWAWTWNGAIALEDAYLGE